MLWYFPSNFGRNVEHFFTYYYALAQPDDLVWMRFQCICEDIISLDAADDAVITVDIVNFTGGVLDPSWDAGDFSAAFGHLETMLQTYATVMATDRRWTKINAYAMSFNPNWPSSDPTNKDIHPFNKSGAPVETRAVSYVGNSTVLPAQVSFTVTEEVPVRPNWGRIYFPSPGGTVLRTDTGRWNTTQVTAIVTAVFAAYDALATGELFPCVPTTSSSKNRVASLQNVVGVRGDDVPDIQRRRRMKHSSFVQRYDINSL
jgi:hypothetical protein